MVSLEEPIAIAQAFGMSMQKLGRPAKFVVYHLGGTSIEISVLTNNPQFRILHRAQILDKGGCEIDFELMEAYIEQFKRDV